MPNRRPASRAQAGCYPRDHLANPFRRCSMALHSAHCSPAMTGGVVTSLGVGAAPSRSRTSPPPSSRRRDPRARRGISGARALRGTRVSDEDELRHHRRSTGTPRLPPSRRSPRWLGQLIDVPTAHLGSRPQSAQAAAGALASVLGASLPPTRTRRAAIAMPIRQTATAMKQLCSNCDGVRDVRAIRPSCSRTPLR